MIRNRHFSRYVKENDIPAINKKIKQIMGKYGDEAHLIFISPGAGALNLQSNMVSNQFTGKNIIGYYFVGGVTGDIKYSDFSKGMAKLHIRFSGNSHREKESLLEDLIKGITC